MDFIATLQAYVNLKAVLLSVIICQGVKYYLPGPIPGEKSFEILPGKLWTRLMPFLPLVIGIVICLFIERDGMTSTDDVVRGFLSGSCAAYLYRTTQVTIFGA